MGMIARYLERLGVRLRGQRPGPPAVVADARGLQIGEQSIAWADVCRLQAYKRDAYVGDCLCLGILGSDGRVFELTESSPGWPEAGDAIERHLPDSMAHAEWMLRLIAGEPGESVAVYPVA